MASFFQCFQTGLLIRSPVRPGQKPGPKSGSHIIKMEIIRSNRSKIRFNRPVFRSDLLFDGSLQTGFKTLNRTGSISGSRSDRSGFQNIATKFLVLLILLSAIPLAIIISLESTTPTTHYYQFHSTGWFRESSKWDESNNRFIVSFTDTGGLGVVNVPDDHNPNVVLQEIPVVKNTDAVGNGTCGVFIDRPRNRVVVAIADVFGNRYSAVAAYDLDSWKRLFFTQLSYPGGEKSFADDVTVDAKGNAYVTDAKGTQIWKVGIDGQLLSTIKSPLFHAKEWYNDIITLNGIVYHPNGYLLVAHTITGNLFKVEINDDNKVTLVNLDNKLTVADGLELLSPTKLVVAGANGVKLVESNDDWLTASLVGRSSVLTHRIATAPIVKNGKVYINHALGMGYPKKKHVFVEAAFS